MTGYGDSNLFGINDPITRAQIAVILWRYINPGEASTFDSSSSVNHTGKGDVESGQWYTDAVNWAISNGVMSGYAGSDLFGTNDPLSFEQLLVVLNNLSDYRDGSYRESLINQFIDGNQVSSWARLAMAHFIERGFAQGSDGWLYPQQSAPRSRVAAILQHWITNS